MKKIVKFYMQIINLNKKKIVKIYIHTIFFRVYRILIQKLLAKQLSFYDNANFTNLRYLFLNLND